MAAADGDGLIERDVDLARGGQAVARAVGGSGEIVTVLGAPGIGKTSLLGALRGASERAGMLVLSARGSELERSYGYGVARQLLEPALVAAGPTGREQLLEGSAEHAAPAVLAPPSVEAGEAEPATLHGLYWLVANLAEGSPLVLSVDDAHWADAASLRFLAYLAGRIEGLPVMLAVAAREGEPDGDEPALGAIADAATLTLRPGSLGRDSVGELLRRRLGHEPSAAFAAACHEAAGGNPFLVSELAAGLEAEAVAPDDEAVELVWRLGPPGVSRSVLARIERVGGQAPELARALAILGGQAYLEDAAELAGLGRGSAETAADALVAAGVLADCDPPAFVHPIVRSAIYADLAPSRRARGHREAAAILGRRGFDPERVAAHLLPARPAGEAGTVERLREAADRALARGATESAAAYLQRAAAEPPDDGAGAEVLASLGRTLAMAGRREEAIARLREALGRLEGPIERAGAAEQLAGALVVEASGGREAVQVLDAAIAELPAGAEAEGSRLEAGISTADFVSLPARREAAGRTRRFADADSPALLAGDAMAVALREGPAARAAELARRALAGDRLLAEATADSASYWLAPLALLWAGEPVEAEGAMSRAMSEARRRGSMRGTGLAACFRALARLERGELLGAEEDGRLFLELAPESFEIGPAFLVDALREQGRLDEASELQPELQGGVEVAMHLFAIRSKAHLDLAAGRGRQALQGLRELGRGLEEWGTRTPGPLQWRPLAAEAHAGLGEPDAAEDLIGAELDSCREYGSPARLGAALTSSGLVRRNDPELAIASLTEAERILAPTPARLLHARCLHHLGSALRRAGRRTQSRESLRRALSLARGSASMPLARAAYYELQATGARPHRILAGGLDALTASERRVAEMAAAGQSNRAIAQDLFVTTRTVETHLNHCFRKLDIASRRELAARLHADGRAPG